MRCMKVEEIAEAIAKLPPDQLARFRRWFTAFEAGRSDHAKELDSTATKLGRLAGRALAELNKRAKESAMLLGRRFDKTAPLKSVTLQSPGNGTLRHPRPSFFFQVASFSCIVA